MKFLIQFFSVSIITSFLLLVTSTSSYGQAHTFSTYNTGTITSGTAGVSTTLSTTGLSGDYLFYVVTADFAAPGASPAFSSTIQFDFSDSSGTVYKDSSWADGGKLFNADSTTLTWSGAFKEIYNGGGNLIARFSDTYNTSGPYTSNLTNVTIRIYKAESIHTFSTFSPGTVTSGTAGVATSLTTTGLTDDYLFYVVSADFVGTGGSPAYSNTMELELSKGSTTVFKEGSIADGGALSGTSSTTLSWVGVMNVPYTGGDSLTARFFDDYNSGGPYTSSVTNVSVKIYKVGIDHAFSSYDPGTLSSGNSGISTSLTTTGINGQYIFYTAEADFVGTGASQSFSTNVNLELSNGGSTIYKPVSRATYGKQNNSDSTVLKWSGILNNEYVGGGNLTARFYDDNSSGGPYASSITNVVIELFMLSACDFNSEIPTIRDSTYVSTLAGEDGTWSCFCNNTGQLLLALDTIGTEAVVPANGVSLRLGSDTTLSWTDSGGIVGNPLGGAIIDRKWEVAASSQPSSNVKVRYFFTENEFQALKDTLANHNGGSNPTTLYGPAEMQMYKITSAGTFVDPHSSGATGLILPQGAVPSTTVWEYSVFGSDHQAEFEVSSFSGGGGGGGGGGPLPVDLLEFNAELLSSNDVWLNWKTASEQNNSHFEIERSYTGSAFRTIGRVEGSNTRNQIESYEFLDTDMETNTGEVYYRLAQFDYNGHKSFSAVKKIDLVKKRSVKAVVYPNPFLTELNIHVNSDLFERTTTITIADLNGKVVYLTTGSQDLNTLQLNTDDWNRGVYILTIMSAGNSENIKLIKM